MKRPGNIVAIAASDFAIQRKSHRPTTDLHAIQPNSSLGGGEEGNVT